MIIIVNGTDLLKSMRFLTLVAKVTFEPEYEMSKPDRVEQRMKELTDELVEVMNKHFPEWDIERLTDQEYINRQAYNNDTP